MGKKLSRKFLIRVVTQQSEEGTYSSATLDSREFTIGFEVPPAKIGRFLQRQLEDITETVADLHGELPDPATEVEVTASLG